MSDAGFVAAAYAIVLGGLAGYVLTIARRRRAALRMADAIGRERDRAAVGAAAEQTAGLSTPPAEVQR